MKHLRCLAAVTAAFLLAPICAADATKEFNGLTEKQVAKGLEAPYSKYECEAPGITNCYYKDAHITFTKGFVSECEFYGRRAVTAPAVTAPASSAPRYRYPYPPITSPVTTSHATTARSAYTIAPSISTGKTCQTPSTGTYLGKLSTNKYDPDSVSNPYGRYGSPYGETITNPYSRYGSRYSSQSPWNPYAADAPRIYASDGTYLGKLSTNRYDPESISNPYGPYGSRYGNNLMNPYSTYGSKYSSQSWTNPYTTTAPKIYSSPSTTYSLPQLPSSSSGWSYGTR